MGVFRPVEALELLGGVQNTAVVRAEDLAYWMEGVSVMLLLLLLTTALLLLLLEVFHTQQIPFLSPVIRRVPEAL